MNNTTQPSTTSQDTYQFLEEISLDSLSSQTLISYCNTHHSEYLLYLPLLLRHIVIQPKSEYKIALIKAIVKTAIDYGDVYTRIFWLHRAGGICVCSDPIFCKLVVGGFKGSCYLLQLIDEKRKKLVDKRGEVMKDINYQNEDIISWIAAARDELLLLPKDSLRPTLYLHRNYLPETLQMMSLEELQRQRITVLNYTGNCDPFLGEGVLVKMVALKSYKSATTPISLMFYYGDMEDGQQKRRRVMFKYGDDLRRDMAVQIMFNVFNVLWTKSSFQAHPTKFDETTTCNPVAVTYSIVPTGPKEGVFEMLGCIEEICACEKHPELHCCPDGWEFEKLSQSNKDCPICSINLKIDEYLPKELATMISTLSGGFIASYCLGVRDRHLENWKFHLCDKSFAHIDFGFVINLRPKFDANRFAIPTIIRTSLCSTIVTLEKSRICAWDLFVQNCTSGFLALRRHVGMIIRMSVIVFGFDQQFDEAAVTKCLTDAFALSIPESDAANMLIGNLQNSSIQKMVKDKQHKVLKFVRKYF
ncbi:Phosphatidylinositol-4 [Entamoeba marina]